MSIQAIAWVLDHSEATGRNRLVLIALANHANHAAECWPSVPTIAREAKVHRATVFRALNELVEMGELERFSGGLGPGDMSVYRFPHVGDNPGDNGELENDKGRSSQHKGRSSQHKGRTAATQNRKNRKEPRKGRILRPLENCSICDDEGIVYDETTDLATRCSCRDEISNG